MPLRVNSRTGGVGDSIYLVAERLSVGYQDLDNRSPHLAVGCLSSSFATSTNAASDSSISKMLSPLATSVALTFAATALLSRCAVASPDRHSPVFTSTSPAGGLCSNGSRHELDCCASWLPTFTQNFGVSRVTFAVSATAVAAFAPFTGAWGMCANFVSFRHKWPPSSDAFPRNVTARRRP